MITNSFDNNSPAKINVTTSKNATLCTACIITFSNIVQEYVLKNFKCEKVAEIKCVTGPISIYKLNYKNKTFTFYKTYMGAPACVGALESSQEFINTKNYIVFGGAGCLDKTIARGKVMVPTFAYRDEGTSYHYKQAEDYIEVKNTNYVANFMQQSKIPYVQGKTWTTDAFYRETINNFEKRKSEGCISVEMECSAMQAVCDFRNLNLYYFLTSGDLLDAPEWTDRKTKNQTRNTQHDYTHFDIALELAATLN